jgi:hypothetical protein
MDCDSGGSAMTFRATVLTLYPDMFPGPLGASLAGKALGEGIWSLDATNIRDFATDKHRSVDDTPAGGGAGMVLRPDVLAAALDSVADGRPTLALTPRGANWRRARGSSSSPEGSRDSTSESSKHAASNRCRSATMSCPAGSLARWSSSMLA